MKIIKKVQAEFIGGKINCSVLLNKNLEGAQFAYYIFRDNERIHTSWYSSSPSFSFDTEKVTGDYHVVGFLRVEKEPIEIEKSNRVSVRLYSSINTSLSQKVLQDLTAELKYSFSRPFVQVPQDFDPVVNKNFNESGFFHVPLAKYYEKIEIGELTRIDWRRKFEASNNSNVMWLLSLNFAGCLLSTFEVSKDPVFLSLATQSIESFLTFVTTPENRLYVESIASGDHSTATRVKVFIKYLQVTQDSEVECKGIRLQVFCELYRCLEWLSSDDNFHENNHGLMCNIALAAASRCFSLSSDLRKKYYGISISRTLKLAEKAFCKDGLCNENTIGYHNYNLQLYQVFCDLLDAEELTSPEFSNLRNIINRAEVSLRHCVRQDGSVPPVGDSPAYLSKKSSINQSKFFPRSGFAVVKNEDFYLSLQCGSRTEVHKQMDDSSITLRYKGVDILIDAGSYSYDRETGFGRYIESATGHTGIYPLAFDYLRRREIVKTFGGILGGIDYFCETDSGFELRCHYKTQDGTVSAGRTIIACWPDEIWINDTIEIHKALPSWRFSEAKVQRFLFGPNIMISQCEPGEFILRGSGISGKLFSLNSVGGRLTFGQTDPDIRGWHSIEFGEILENSCLEFISTNPVASFTVALKLSEGATMSQLSKHAFERLSTDRLSGSMAPGCIDS
ncbi:MULTISPECIES: heparinase II/III family protein [unclassified Pseudomonas]|uniref:heparinase II/III domain-containing protein n=1 Tax=unclassified Pseudomonas TaxID=196821 RepID=UPI000D95C39E|nr:MULTISPECIES: heparinase II/III family protein [unclassified Pseudomonas]PYG78762.1 heparinase II/III-like protein [Pseudomonas sp. RV120224-01c]PYG82299.1 heparinase II/III-like protein [Pseudomonas sp. RV120224-01b]